MTLDLSYGFSDPVSSAQSTFRVLMNALSRPGSLHVSAAVTATPVLMSRSCAAVALTLFDHDTPIWLDEPLARSTALSDWIRFHTGAPIIGESRRATFAIISDPKNVPPFEQFNLGSAEYPDHSTTIILEVETLESGMPLSFTGPGIKTRSVLRPNPLPTDFAQRLAANHALFPRGVDLLLTSPTGVAALPRTIVLDHRS